MTKVLEPQKSDVIDGFIIEEKDTGAREDQYSGQCDCYCQSRGCECDCHDCAFWQDK